MDDPRAVCGSICCSPGLRRGRPRAFRAQAPIGSLLGRRADIDPESRRGPPVGHRRGRRSGRAGVREPYRTGEGGLLRGWRRAPRSAPCPAPRERGPSRPAVGSPAEYAMLEKTFVDGFLDTIIELDPHPLRRLKTCLRMLGRFAEDVMLPPQIATPPQEHGALRAALAIARGIRSRERGAVTDDAMARTDTKSVSRTAPEVDAPPGPGREPPGRRRCAAG